MTPHGRIMVIDDEPDIVEVVRTYLEREGFEVLTSSDGAQAIEAVDRFAPDLVILDVMLPGLDGLNVCREIRKTRTMPILMLSARGDDLDKILGLEIGADDYMTKPFNPKELVARVRAMFRRQRMAGSSGDEEIIVRRKLRVEVAAQRVLLDGTEVRLTPIEFGLLKTLAANAGTVLSRQDLMTRVWGPDYFGDERTVDVHIRHLRAKLQAAAAGPQYVVSVWGVGYKYET
jgi:two-component system alkaline phosphatase synthesis response regulator PhoP